jgi:hypothetical protein
MAAKNLKQWHWIIAGAVVGALLVYLQLQLRTVQRFEGMTTVDPKTFGNSIGEKTVSEGILILRNVTVYPPYPSKSESDPTTKARQIVTGEIASESHHDGHATYVPFVMFAPVPFNYNSKIGIPGADYSVRDLLDHRLQIGQRMTPYRYAWWASTPMTIALWGGGSIVLIGGVWPLLIALMSGQFAAKKSHQKEYDLDRFASDPQTNATIAESSAPMSDDGEITTAAAAITSAPAHTIKQLDTESLAPLPQQSESEHHYQGEFYPVERNAKSSSEE